MIKKIIRGFFSFIRFIVCFCLIILINTLMFIEASDVIYDNPKESNRLQASKLRALSLNLEEIPESEISPMIKELDYKAKTRMTDFGDYKIETNVTDSDIIVIAIHGGKIEQGTTELAYALSSRNYYNYFSFLGVKNYENSNLHVASDKFKEPAALEMVSKSETTLSIHGCSGSEEFTYVGGRDTELANKIKQSLAKYGFTVSNAPRALGGKSPDNIVNKNKHGSGVQIELSQGLRTQFLSGDSKLLESYVDAISEAVNSMKTP